MDTFVLSGARFDVRVTLRFIDGKSRFSPRILVCIFDKICKSCCIFYITFLLTILIMERHQKEYEFFTILSKHKIWKYLTLLISKRRVLKRLKRTCFNLNRIHNTRLEKRSCTLLVRDLRASFTHEKPALIQKESFQHSLRYQYTPFVIIHAWIFLAFSFPSVSFFSLPFFKRVNI